MARSWPRVLSAAAGTGVLLCYIRCRNARRSSSSSTTPRKFDAVDLGGTLFVPATHKNLQSIASGEKYPSLRSVVFDLEDGIGKEDLDAGLSSIAGILPSLPQTKLLRFIRPRDPTTLSRLLKMAGIDRVDGFILPKFGLGNAGEYLKRVGSHFFMPSVEGVELFDAFKLAELREVLLPYRRQIILIRFGGEDMMRQLGLRRTKDVSLYDLVAPARVISSILLTFKPHGFQVSAPVYRFHQDIAGFETEVQRDLKEGLLSKTIIHPDQIEAIERLYQVTEQEYQEAQALVQSKKAVFALGGAMAEVSTQLPWAQSILKRADLYGIIGRKLDYVLR